MITRLGALVQSSGNTVDGSHFGREGARAPAIMAAGEVAAGGCWPAAGWERFVVPSRRSLVHGNETVCSCSAEFFASSCRFQLFYTGNIHHRTESCDSEDVRTRWGCG